MKMIVVSSGQLTWTSSKPLMASLLGQGCVKPVRRRGCLGGNQILTVKWDGLKL